MASCFVESVSLRPGGEQTKMTKNTSWITILILASQMQFVKIVRLSCYPPDMNLTELNAGIVMYTQKTANFGDVELGLCPRLWNAALTQTVRRFAYISAYVCWFVRYERTMTSQNPTRLWSVPPLANQPQPAAVKRQSTDQRPTGRLFLPVV